MQWRLIAVGLIVVVIIGIVVVVAGSVVAGVDTAIYPAWMWIISLVVIIFLTAIVAVLLVGWQDSHYESTRLKKNVTIETAAAKSLLQLHAML